MSKKILGLDLGTNSIGWSLIEQDFENKTGKILGLGCRIIPMGQELSKFEQGQAQTKNANRRIARGMRKLNKRYKQRRNKLIYVLQQLGMLPEQIKLAEPFFDPLKLERVSILPIDRNQKQYSALDLLELRVKALNEAITLQELGRLIYLFNHLRGYSGGGNEPEKEDNNEDETESEEKKGKESYVTFGKILSVSEPETVTLKGKEQKKRSAKIETEEGELEGDTFLEILKVGESLELLVSITTSKKHGETITFKLPNKTNWRKKMENLEKELTELSKEKGREIYLSEYFLSVLKENRWAKIRNNVILRSRYQSEFDKIWKTQSSIEGSPLHNLLKNLPQEKLSEILQFIFPGIKETQEKYRQEGKEKGLYHVIRNQIIYYQRELKDQSHLISDCRFEKGEKAVAKSHPVFQEYKIWEQINKLSINTKIEDGKNRRGEVKYKYIDRPIPSTLKEWLFDELQEKGEIGFSVIFNKLKKEYKLQEGVEFLNGMNPKAKLRGNETKLMLKKALGEQFWEQLGLSEKSRQIELWDILYNAKGNEYDIESERTSKILSFIKKYSSDVANPEQTAIQISKIKFSRSYAALSLKAIEKILPLVRSGKYFSNDFTEPLKETIIKLVNETVNDPFEKAAQEYLETNVEVLAEGGIMNAYATILVYGKHTAKEYSEEERIKNFYDIKRLTPGELRNPLVEQLISEALMVVKDIWRKYGKPDEVRLELARELKNNAERRNKIYKANTENQKANDEVKNLLIELKQEVTLNNIEKYKLWLSQENLADEYVKQYKDPSKSEIEKMKLWREQGHVSPYTGQPIPLSDLFNRERYDFDHIIPQSRYFDDSFVNKVICEKSINKEKGNRTAMEYFEVGSTIPSVFSKEDFINHVNKYFQGAKRKNLLATKVPEDPIARQIKETQYISVRVKEELNKLVGNENVKTTTGGVTDYLRNQWGLTDKFKKLLKGRYEKIKEEIAVAEYEKRKGVVKDKDAYIESYKNQLITTKNNKLVIKGWTKRIDHRHHAIDALVIACTEPAHVKRLNDLNKELQTWLDEHKKDLLPNFEGSPSELLDEILNLNEAEREKIFMQIEKFRTIDLPWAGFPEDAEKEIQNIIVSQKPKDKLLIQPNKNGTLQIKIRGQLHEPMPFGLTNSKEAKRYHLTDFAKDKFATEKNIEKITDEKLKTEIRSHFVDKYKKNKKDAFSIEGIMEFNSQRKVPVYNVRLYYKNQDQKISISKLGQKKLDTPALIELIINDEIKQKVRQHLEKYNGDKSKAFSKEGILELNKNEKKPIKSLKLINTDTNDTSNDISLQRLDRKKAYNNNLLVNTGDNYLFAVMEKDGNRIFDLITFFDATNLLKDEFNKATDKASFSKEQIFKKYFEEKNKAKLLFTLKQGDPVYMPSEGEEVITDPQSLLYKAFWEDKASRSKNIHYVTKYSGNEIYFINHSVADPIVKGKEFGSQNAYQNINGSSIKQYCIKLDVDRLGNISLPKKSNYPNK
ncbi:MAG: hypothetical protein LC128_06430 [Chitinophagales bacterium]|nr:hypothetical protein [Chitinophagales bacterium]